MASSEDTIDSDSPKENKETPAYCANLPIEIIIYILQFLKLSDRQCAGQVCRQWYEASRDARLCRNETVVLHDDISKPLQIFETSQQSYNNFVFKEAEVGNCLINFWKKYCPKMKQLSLHKCDLSEGTFIDILSQCHYLESLDINACRELLMSGRVLESESDIILLRSTLKNLKKLSLEYNRYLSDALFNRFVSTASSLEDLSLEGCQVTFHCGIYKRFYAKGISVGPSGTVLTFQNVLEYITLQARKLKKLHFGSTLMDDASLTKLSMVPELSLMSLDLQKCDQLTNNGVIQLCNYQKYLIELDLSMCSRLTDNSLLAICRNLSELKILRLDHCSSITNIGVAEMLHLKKLQDLNLSHCELVTGEGIIMGLCTYVNPVFRKLNLTALHIDENSVCQLSEKLLKLTHLNLGYCFNGVTDRSVQAICRNQIWLQSLKLTGCNKVSDAGLTGMGPSSSVEDNSRISEQPWRQILEGFSDPLHKISLRTRAEKEIVFDSKRKDLVQQMCEDQFQGEINPKYSLCRMRGLRVLDLCDCNRITDVSLKYAFIFPELHYLNLSLCQQVSDLGLSYLGINNPSIETLILSQCYNISDNGIISVVQNLPRLKHLEMQSCIQLTDTTLESLTNCSNSLCHLNVSLCQGMSLEGCEQVESNLSSLRTFEKNGLYSKHRTKDKGKQKPIPVPPPSPSSKGKFYFLNR